MRLWDTAWFKKKSAVSAHLYHLCCYRGILYRIAPQTPAPSGSVVMAPDVATHMTLLLRVVELPTLPAFRIPVQALPLWENPS